MVHSKKVYIHTICCLRRRIDAEKICNYFEKNNYKITYNLSEADFIILFTCGFVNDTIERNLNTIEQFKKYNGKLIVAGCLPDIAREKLDKIYNGPIIPTRNLHQIDEIFTDCKIRFSQIESANSPWENFNPFYRLDRYKKSMNNILEKNNFFKKSYNWISEEVFTKIPLIDKIYCERNFEKKYYNGITILISRGCIHNCSYCAIRKAVGPLKSKPVKKIIEEFQSGIEKGHNTFILEADDVGIYGFDLKHNLPQLLNQMTEIDGDYNIRLGVIHPIWVIRYINELKQIIKRKKIKSIVLSIQSGNNRILKSMHRSYTREQVNDIIKELKSAYNDIDIGAQFIVGFPNESNEDFLDTYNLIKEGRFDYGGVFNYSEVEGTESCKIYPKISENEKYERLKKIYKLIKKQNTYVWNSGRGVSFYN